jgi:hypothetical protein
MKIMGRGDPALHLFDVFVFELINISTFRTDHVIVMMTQMPMFVTHFSIVESVFPGKPESTHQPQGVPDKVGREKISVIIKELGQLAHGNVTFGLKKNFQDLESIFELIDVFLLEQFLKLFFFPMVNTFHVDSYKKANFSRCEQSQAPMTVMPVQSVVNKGEGRRRNT